MNFGRETSSGFSDGLLSSFFKALVPFGCTLTVVLYAHRFHSDSDDTFCLKGFKQAFENSILTLTIHAHIDRMPISELFRQCSPLVAVLCDIQNCVHQLVIAHAYTDSNLYCIVAPVFLSPCCVSQPQRN